MEFIHYQYIRNYQNISRNSQKQPSIGVLIKGVLKICCKFTGEHPCHCNLIEIILRHECSLTNLLHIFRTSFYKNTSGWLLLNSILLYWLNWPSKIFIWCSENHMTFHVRLKTQRQISKKRSFENYCSCDKACQFSAL